MPWKTYYLTHKEPQYIALGKAIELRLERQNHELWVSRRMPDSLEPGPEADGHKARPPGSERWVLPQDKRKKMQEMPVSLRPLFPERPLILRPESPLRLLAGSELVMFIRVPVYVALYDENARPVRLLTELPVIRLSNTWFGSMTEGEMCYWLKTRARSVPESQADEPHLCSCPIHIVNTSDEELLVDKLCLRLDPLSIYEDEGRLWSDQMNIFYKGEEKFSDLDAAGTPPAQAPAARLLSPPRKPDIPNIARRTFKALHQLHPFSVFN